MNIVQFPKYLLWFEDGLVSLLHDLGYHSGEIFQERQVAFPVRELAVKYYAPAHFDEILVIVSSISSLGTTSLVTSSTAYRDGELLAEGTSVRVCLNVVTGAKVPLVEAFRDLV
jgi:acyl-CoA thioester hydrolase